MSEIEWTDVTANPFPGCRKISPGCENCYAERLAMRLKAMGQTKYAACVDGNGWTGEIGYNPSCMSVPGKGKLVFVNSMGDLFYEKIDGPYIRDAFTWIRKQPEHTFQVLTKRAERAAQYFAAYTDDPPANVWLGVTAENQEWADKRIPILLQIPAAVRFVSLEPLLGPVDLHRVKDQRQPHKDFALTFDSLSRKGGIALKDGLGIDWVIVGCESGPKRRPCDNQWIAAIVSQCHAAGVPVFVKQIQVKGLVVRDANQISNMLGYPAENIRQFPTHPRIHASTLQQGDSES